MFQEVRLRSTAKLECAGCCDPTRLIIFCSCDSAHCAPCDLITLVLRVESARARVAPFICGSTLTSQRVTAEQRPIDAAPLARPAAQRGLRARHESPIRFVRSDSLHQICSIRFAPSVRSDLLHLICLFRRPLEAFLQIRSIRFVCSDSFLQICLFSGFKGFEWIAACAR